MKVRVSIDVRKNARENAKSFFEQSKKFSKKAEGCRNAIIEAKHKLEEFEKKQEVAEIRMLERRAALQKKGTAEKRWFEKFKWFRTSGGRLAIGGRDATTNEILVKKHMEEGDAVFHADVPGSPFLILKDGKNASEEELLDAARFTASHSRAWREGLGSVDVYWVNPDQVSKTPPAGEYVSRGSFMIYGRKNYYRNTPLKICIGFDGENVISGPLSAVSSATKTFCEITPGALSQSAAAKKIVNELKLHGRAGVLDEIQRLLPSGGTNVIPASERNRRRS